MSDVSRVLAATDQGAFEVRRWQLAALRPDAVAPTGSATVDPHALLRQQAQQALREAETVLAQALAQRDSVEQEREEVLADARRQGWEEGRRKADAERAAQRDEVGALLASLPDAWQRFCEAQTPTLTALCVVAAEKLLHEQLTLEPERIVAVVRAAIAHIPHAQRLVVQVHPEDLPLLQDATLNAGRLVHEIVLEADSQLQRGGCRIESRQGVVDASQEGALVRLSALLTED